MQINLGSAMALSHTSPVSWSKFLDTYNFFIFKMDVIEV